MVATEPRISFPAIRPVGLTGMLVTFADHLDEAENRAALAFRAAVQDAGWDGIEETSTSLASAFLRFDPLRLAPEGLRARLTDLLASRDWSQALLPTGRRLFRVPTVYGTDLAPQLEEAAAAAGLDPEAAIADLSTARVRVLTIGFAPGQPYLGRLGARWDLPRQSTLTAQVPVGALVLAVRQFTLFSAAAPTGWRHVGQTNFRGFRPEAPAPFALAPGDEMIFPAIAKADFLRLRAAGEDGASIEEIVG